MNNNEFQIYRDGQKIGNFQSDELSSKFQSGEINANDHYWTIGMADWQPVRKLIESGIIQGPPPSPLQAQQENQNGDDFFSAFAGKVSQASGLEKIEGFSIGALFSQTFKHHSPEEIEQHFSVGTAKTTPPLNEVLADWPTPWAFIRLLGMSIASSIAFYYAIARFASPMLIPGWIFVGCFGIPFAVLVFFMETNVLRNVSFYRLLSLMFSGGLLSLITSLFLYEYSNLSAWIGAMSAGFIEESGKLLAVIFLTRKWLNYGWTLNGLLFGAAVGTGFSAFESAGYVFMALGEDKSIGSEGTMILRAFLSPFTHTIWTAAAAAALWRIRLGKKFDWSMISEVQFLRVFAMSVGLHIVWNSPLRLPMIGETAGYFGLRLILGLIGWIVAFALIQTGIKEVRAAKSGLTTRIAQNLEVQ